MKVLYENEVLARLRKECKRAKGQLNWAKANGVSPQYLSDVLRGKSDIGPLILKAMRLELGEKLYAPIGVKITRKMVEEEAVRLYMERKARELDAAKRAKAATEVNYG